MSEQTPSQAEGERRPEAPADDGPDTSSRREVPRTTPSQAEGADPEHEDGDGEDGEKDGKGRESGRSGQ
ncbi:hypothetical protein PV379_31955 [Streptomyces caniscabiei]|uniref:hypothetical protein n=1 Tax=Streptomyces caniscabiei TaxID=2746961 RepID=UPI0029BB7DF5|nr:hypothetical protein [Streptomyces caniscabiei]MDX2602516.1 hypothetical protein [Streptomyces caniscabiei]MDX2734372.1 hypothetical protein [Streptomyces caniscabiei]MDX2781884.1 hypothetical protein [Streptomyces caniscabiei]